MPSQSWYIHIRGETFGPLPTELLTILLRQNRLQFSDWVWNDQLPRWARLEELDPFRTLLPEYPNAPLPTGQPAPVAAAPVLAPLPQAAPPPPVAAPAPVAPAPVAAPAPAAGGFQPLPFPPIQRPAAVPARPAGLAPTFPSFAAPATAAAAAPAVAAAPAPIPQAAPAPLYVVPPAQQEVAPQQPVQAVAPQQQPLPQAPPQAPVQQVTTQASQASPPPPPQEEIQAQDPASQQKVWIRRHMRIAIEGFAEVDQFGDFQVYDVSEGGMFVVSKTPIPFGTDVKLKLSCPNMPKPLEMTGIVIREGLSEGGEAGFAIQFTRVNPAHRRAIQDLVRQKLGQA